MPEPALAFPREAYRARRDRTLAAMAARRLDARLVFAADSIYYLTGLDVYGIRAHQALVVSRAPAGPCLVQRVLAAPGVALTSVLSGIVSYQVPAAAPVARVLDVVRGRGLTRGSVGLERASLTAAVAERYAPGLAGAAPVNAADPVGELRLVKSRAPATRASDATAGTD